MGAVIAGLVIACSAVTACNGSGEAHTSTTASAPSPTVSPTSTLPPPGHWTMKDLEVEREIPPEALEQLIPPLEVPDEPSSIEHATEQAAADAAVYFAELSQVSFQQQSSDVLDRIDWEYCVNCADLRQVLDESEFTTRVHWKRPQFEVEDIRKYQWQYPLYVARISFSWENAVYVDSKTNEIQDQRTTGATTWFFGVGFHDGRWRPIYMNLTEEPNIER